MDGRTHVFTKAMGEMLIDDTRGDIPLVIIRPGDIGSTDKEPFPGWIEGNRIADPLIRLYGKGQLSGFPGDPNGVLDAVPADFVVNAIWAATAKHGAVGKSESSTVYQVASSVINPLLVNETLAQLGYEYFNSMPCTDSMGRPIQVLEPKIYSSMEDFKSHLWTEAIQYSKLTALANQNSKVSPKPINIGRITTECLKFDSSNTQRLMQCMCEEERSKFGFDLASIDWKVYVFNTHIPEHRKSLSITSESNQSTNRTPSRASKLRDRLSALRHSVLSQFTRKNKPDSCLDLPRSNGRLLVIPSEPRGFLSELLEDVVDEAVHDPHGLARDPDVRMNLFQHLEDVDLVGLNALLRPLLLLFSGGCSALLRQLLPGLRFLLRRSFLGDGALLLLRWLLLGGLLLSLWRH
ncbi:hypothetical protein HYC85_008820 [Camellia sinensis]|uniref:Fatty acyl-CoA reductase n=1 Tax=Camellia sinensis TaxID=4442 RepID=A0A7J7HV61_CAMSI|nr:hypothetical protein HYC85_008820 [Camellia sinensis]